MLKTVFRFYPCVTSVHFWKQLICRDKDLVPNRRWCSLPQESNSKKSPVLKILAKAEQQNVSQEEETNQNSLEKPVQRRRQFHHPSSLVVAIYRSEFLRNMVDIGVNLFEIQQLRPLDFDFIVSLRSWDPDPPQRIKYLLQLGVPDESIGKIITANPRILKENMEDMLVRVNYLESKNFSSEDIANIVAGCPKLLSMKTEEIDSRLGYFQHGYKLSGNQVRSLAINNPWLISWPQRKLRDTLDVLSDELSFNITEMKSLLLNHGRIWKRDVRDLRNTAKYLHFELKMSHKKIAQYGQLLTRTRVGLKYRYDFMVFMKRANFDPDKPYYHSYDILWEGTLEEFCKKLNTNMEALELYAKSV